MADTPEVKPSVKFFVDGQETSAAAGTTILEAAKKVDKVIPHFCYHPGLSIVGQCRMCFVEIEGAPKLATACSTTVTEGMKVLTDSPKVKSGQNSTLEFTLLNHPLDCPICDRGGECKLQDYTYEFGPPRSRMVDDKMEKDKHRPISAQVVLDQERCILCTRCIRFSSEVDGRGEIVVNERGSHATVDVFEGRPLQSAFSGNVVDLCPVGALTAKDFRFEARPWELKRHEAICSGCAVGCNVEIHTKTRPISIPRPDKKTPVPRIERIIPRENKSVNTWWLCDKGRWGYHFHNENEKRLDVPMIRRTPESAAVEVSLREVQVLLDGTASLGSWEFWVGDNLPHEGITWAKELLASWTSRGKKVAPTLNANTFGDEFLKVWAAKAASPWFAGPADWTEITTVVSPYDYRELEAIAPILALRLGQAVRRNFVKMEKVATVETAKFDLGTTAFLVSPPRSEADLKALASLDPKAKVLPLFTQSNSRGLLSEGIAPVEVIAASLEGKTPAGPVFFLAQRTQNKPPKALLDYLSRAPFLVVADSFASPLSEKASAILPLTPLYESQATMTNLENRRQVSSGIHINHPNAPVVHRGGPLVSASLRLI